MRKSGTCIAYRDGKLAADTVSHYDDVKVDNDIKIMRVPQGVFGCSGGNCPPLALVARKLAGEDVNLSNYEFTCMLITPEKEIRLSGGTDAYDVVKMPFFAIGSGAAFAIGAMYMGGNAKEAVKAAIAYAPLVGGNVYCLSI